LLILFRLAYSEAKRFSGDATSGPILGYIMAGSLPAGLIIAGGRFDPIEACLMSSVTYYYT
jgi:hypothetical protein